MCQSNQNCQSRFAMLGLSLVTLIADQIDMCDIGSFGRFGDARLGMALGRIEDLVDDGLQVLERGLQHVGPPAQAGIGPQLANEPSLALIGDLDPRRDPEQSLSFGPVSRSGSSAVVGHRGRVFWGVDVWSATESSKRAGPDRLRFASSCGPGSRSLRQLGFAGRRDQQPVRLLSFLRVRRAGYRAARQGKMEWQV